MASIRELRQQVEEALAAYHKASARFEKARKRRQEKLQEECTHPKELCKVRTQSYFEEGRMSAPSEWKEKYCSKCKKVLAKTSTEEIWHPVKG